MSSKKDRKLIFTTSDGYFVETTEKEMTRLVKKLRINLNRAIGRDIGPSARVIANHLDCEKLNPEDVAVLIIASAYANTSNVAEYLEFIHEACIYSEDEIIVMLMKNFPLK